MEFTLEDLFFNIPIYTKIEINDSNVNQLTDLTSENTVVEGYNPLRKAQSTFQISTKINYLNPNFFENGGHSRVVLKCKRYGDFFNFYFYLSIDDYKLMKVGQYPSVADFHIGEINQYKKLIPNEKLREFTKAIGLAANGVGIGSYVYLRRIFEYLIDEAYKLALEEGNISEADYQRARMDQKIDLLHNYLPAFLLENKGMYSILSKGVHELDENTCLAHFDTLRVGIEIILDEKLDELRKKEKVEAAKKKLQELKGQIKP